MRRFQTPNESQKINLKCLIYSREISRNVGYSLYKGHFMVKVRSDFWRIYLWIVDFEIIEFLILSTYIAHFGLD